MAIKLIGSSLIMKAVFRDLLTAGRCDKSVLILGETGTGKGLMARKIHELSPRNDEPFLPINCANLSEPLIESELFGHVRGAFTGAVAEKPGILEEAGYGTVFMDEIGELSLPLQAKILRLLDCKESRRIGSNRNHQINARFIFATNTNLCKSVELGVFRKDLYYRINVLSIQVPPLRNRREDIPKLTRCIVDRENSKMGTNKIFLPETLTKLMTYEFPGNVRELENIIERSMASSDHHAISANDITIRQDGDYEGTIVPFDMLKSALECSHWNKTKAAIILGKSRRQLYRLMQRHRINYLLAIIFGSL